MDQQSQEQREIQRLIALGDAARGRLQADVATLRHRLDLPARVRSSLAKHPSTWLAGSLVSGMAASLLFRRKPKPAKKSRVFPAGLLALTLTAARPLVKVWLAGLMKQWAADALSGKFQFPTFILRHPPPSTSAHPAHVHSSGPGSR